MATQSKAQVKKENENICQGDVFKDVRYLYIDSEDDKTVKIVEYKFPMAIIISQACDVISMGEMIALQEGKSTKFMPSILMCPIYDVEVAKRTTHLDQVFRELEIRKTDGKNECLLFSDDLKVAQKDWHYRFHDFSVSIDKTIILEKAVIDFKHYFSIPASYLMKNRANRLFHLEDIFAEQITLKFATYLSRVAIP